MTDTWRAASLEVYQLPVNRVSPCWDSVDKKTRADLAQSLQQRFDELLEADERLKSYSMQMRTLNLKAAIFGGWARDRVFELLRSRPYASRDIDMVVHGEVSVAKALPDSAIENPFGGFGVEGTHIHFDAWDLENTFLIRRKYLPVSFEMLPFTADYTVNALVFMPRQFFETSDLIDAGAVNSIKAGTLDFAADTIAFPLIQAARSVILATKFQLTPSETIRTYLRNVCSVNADLESVIDGINKYCPDQYKSDAASSLTSIVKGVA